MGIVELVLLAGYALLVLLVSFAALSGFRLFRPLFRRPIPGGHRVSIIVAAKDEADTLRESLASLTELEYQDKEVIVVCGPSSDRTEELAQEFAGKVTVLRQTERPADWLGKSWACNQGYLKSTGDVLLFTDGDVIHSRESLGIVLANLESKRSDLLSVWPEIVTRTWSERLILPASIFFLCLGVAAVAAKGTPAGRRVDGANGQYIMIRREAYDAIGGHAAIKTDIMEDSAMGRKAIRKGLEVVNANGEGFLKVKPYLKFDELWEAHERFGAGLVPSRGVLLGSCALTVLYFIFPFVLLGVALGTMDGVAEVFAGSMCALVYATHAFFSRKASRLQYFLLAPLSGLLVTVAFAIGFVRFRREGIRWKGIRYASDRFKPL